MKDEDQIKQLYHDMYDAMVAKDEAELDRVQDDSFILIHMTGMRQDKQTYIRAILDGTLNYYSETTEDLKIHISGNTATLTGHSRVAAAVFGGGRHSWRLELRLALVKQGGEWRFTRAQASTY